MKLLYFCNSLNNKKSLGFFGAKTVDEKVGYIDEDGKIQITNQPKLIRYFYGADPLYADDCKECFYLPICHGRCPHQRIQEELGSVERQPCMKDTKCINRYLEKLIENLSE